MGEVRRKSFSNKIIVTLVTQGSSSLSSSLLLRKLTNDNRRRSQSRAQILFSSHPLEGGDGKKRDGVSSFSPFMKPWSVIDDCERGVLIMFKE